jgi:predicted rRNA methylase YqxC with S4 and FtsJ domains
MEAKVIDDVVFPTLEFPAAAHIGILIAIHGLYNTSAKNITKEHRDSYWGSLNWCIDNIKKGEGNNEFLAWCYNTRGLIYEGRHKFFQS